jgi:hypothetical protein
MELLNRLLKKFQNPSVHYCAHKIQSLVTSHYPQPDESRPHTIILFPYDLFQYNTSIYAEVFLVDSFLHVSLPKFCNKSFYKYNFLRTLLFNVK